MNKRFKNFQSLNSPFGKGGLRGIYFLAIPVCAFFALAGEAQAAIFVDNTVTCNNGSTYNPVNRSCTGGSDKVYTSLNNAHSDIGTPTNEAGRIVVNIRSGTSYTEKLTITKPYTTWQKYPGDSAKPKPIVDGRFESMQSNVAHGWNGLIIILADYVTIDGLQIQHTGHYPVNSPMTASAANDSFTQNPLTWAGITQTAHNWTTKDRIQFTGGSLPPEVNTTAIYYIVQPAATTFKVSMSQGGDPINLTRDGSAIKADRKYLSSINENEVSGYGIGAIDHNHITIKNCKIAYIGGSGLDFYSSSYLTIEDNELYETNYSRTENTVNSWAAGIQTKIGCSHVVIRGNYVHGIGGEGFNLNRMGEDYLIEKNIMEDIWAVAIFPNNIRDVVVRYNLVYHKGTARYLRNQSEGIIVGAEDFQGKNSDYAGYATDIDVYGNVITGYWYPLGIAHVVVGPNEQNNAYKVSHTRFYNNTVIEPQVGGRSFVMGKREGTASMLGDGVEIRNNIFLQTLSSSAPMASIDSTATNATWSNNLWSKAPPDLAKGKGDPGAPEYANSGIVNYFAKTSRWHSLTDNVLTGQEFALKSTATNARGKGANLGAPYNHLLNLTTSNFKTNTFNFKDQPASGAWDIGAGVYVGGDTTAPGSPSGLTVR